ncbi:Hint domain-containing protein [Cognatishimia sp. MH4019]|uniref:Hint domain-containing protein n=1 Tax=Cognatishimia sp. MH4019 TaxID=2854030 RepID=UPI001CD651E2|nr:Hint domain-containing protein [Cognatishimia sp. MH4019]
METGFRGAFVISWSQTETDGLKAAPIDTLAVGATWQWTGELVRVDGPAELMLLERGKEEANLRRRAARSVRRLVGAAMTGVSLDQIEVDEPLMDSGFVVTDGRQTYTITVVEVDGARPLLMFLDHVPPRGRDLWIVHRSIDETQRSRSAELAGGVICFTPGTRIATEDGPRLVEDLRPEDKILTKDNGAQPILWKGSRRMTGARLFAMPEFRPIRLRRGSVDGSVPDSELLVSPEHRMLLKGDAARALFNTSEVLVAAKELVNGHSIIRDRSVREVTYVHLLLEQHQIVWANGIETESFHPANTSLSLVPDDQRAALFEQLPELEHDPHLYGSYARRNLSKAETAVLLQDVAA